MTSLPVEPRLGFRRDLRAEVSDGDGTFLFSERGTTVLSGTNVAALSALLDGSHDRDSLFDALPGGTDRTRVATMLDRLVAAGLVTGRPADPPAADGREQAFWEAAGLDACAASRGVRTGVDLLLPDHPADDPVTRAVEAALAGAGMVVRTPVGPEPPAAGRLSVVLCVDYLSPGLAAVDAAHRAAGRPWLLAKPVGTQIWLGPVFRPGESACWHCLADRLWQHRQAEACAQAALGRSGPAPRPPVTTPALVGTAASLIALEAGKWLAGHRYAGQDAVQTLDGVELERQRHELRRRPQCPQCGDPGLIAASAYEPVVLRPVARTAYRGGGHRAASPEQTWDRFQHLVSPVTGIVKEIEVDPRAPQGFHSFRSGPNVAAGAGPGGLSHLRRSLRHESGGKGVTAEEARTGALCEAVERWSGSFQGGEARRRASLRDLGDAALHPNDVLLYDERQYAGRADWNRQHGPFQYVCDRFDETTQLDWTPTWSLTGQRHRLLPTAMLYYGAPGPTSVRADSNGNAAGSCLEDAVLQGLLELVERDAVALWWYNRTPLPGVDLDAFAQPWLDEIRESYAGLGRTLEVLDMTTDIGVPAMVAVTRRPGSPRAEAMFGFGAHLDPLIALRRAVTELNQLVPAVLAAPPDVGFAPGDPDATAWWRDAADAPYLTADPGTALRRPADYGYRPGPDLTEDLRGLLRLLDGRGLDVLVLDQTRPDAGLPVVKVLVPGLRSMWARFGPGRLFDAPVRMGRLSEPTPYESLNPIPMFL